MAKSVFVFDMTGKLLHEFDGTRDLLAQEGPSGVRSFPNDVVISLQTGGDDEPTHEEVREFLLGIMPDAIREVLHG